MKPRSIFRLRSGRDIGLAILAAGLATAWSANCLSAEESGKGGRDEAQTKETKPGKDGKPAGKEELKLEDLFPEKGLFGPSASGTAFSHDGRYGAYLYRPYAERRHGPDLWLLDTQSGQLKRVTSVSVMCEFQAETRKVKEDRIKKARESKKKPAATGDKPAAEGAAKDKKATSPEGSEEDFKDEDRSIPEEAKGSSDTGKKDKKPEKGDGVDEKDADAEKAPLYGGIHAFEWAPATNEMMFASGGDLYRYVPERQEISRLTRSTDEKRNLRYLPDGGGYTFLRGNQLMCVRFGQHIQEQIEPKVADGERIHDYQISPDGKRVVLVTMKEVSGPATDRKVQIAQYRDRFMNTTQVARQVSDDPVKTNEVSLYVCELGGTLKEDLKTIRILKAQRTGPRDYWSTPDWAPDSSRLAFAWYEQNSGHIQIYEALLDTAREKDKAGPKKEEPAAAGEEKKSGDQPEAEAPPADSGKESALEERPARVVYRILHHGGPTTPNMVAPQYIADSRRLAFLSEQSGYRQLYLLDPLYESVASVTQGSYEIYPVPMGNQRKYLFAAATRDDPARRELFRINPQDRSMEKISLWEGSYQGAAFSPDGAKALANYSTYGRLTELVYIDATREEVKVLTDSHPKKAAELTTARPAFFAYKNRLGHEIRGMMFKPALVKTNEKLPVLVYVYGGPLGERKMVDDGNYAGDPYFFAWYMAQKHGYLAATIDPRGSSGYGGLFEKSNFGNVGRVQVEDLVDGVKWLVEHFPVDAKRVAIHGWSFGGFQTQMCLYTEPDVFAAGMAGAGPTEWENYNSWYSTGTIGPSRTGQTDLSKFSLLPLAKNLKGKLLLVHGMEDDNVLYQDTVRVYRELLKAGKETQVEIFLDPTGKHALGGDVKSLGRYRKYEEFLLRTIGRGPVQ